MRILPQHFHRQWPRILADRPGARRGEASSGNTAGRGVDRGELEEERGSGRAECRCINVPRVRMTTLLVVTGLAFLISQSVPVWCGNSIRGYWFGSRVAGVPGMKPQMEFPRPLVERLTAAVCYVA